MFNFWIFIGNFVVVAATAIASVSMLLLNPAFAAIDSPIRTVGSFQDERTETTENIRVQNVRVVLADYSLIARDFPLMKQKKSESISQWRQRIDSWLVSETGFIRVEQTKQHIVNSPIRTSNEMKTAYRPFGYNRAHIIPVEGGLLDIKGVGTSNPAQRDHANGLATLAELVREFLYEHLESEILSRSELKAKTVGTYAVLDFGFDVIYANGEVSRAGYMLRQAHVRSRESLGQLNQISSLAVESVLRRFGLTSTGANYSRRSSTDPFVYLKAPNDVLNIQGTSNKDIEVVDFGAHLSVETFFHPLVYQNGAILLEAGRGQFIQPDSDLRVPLNEWGGAMVNGSIEDKIWIEAKVLVERYVRGEIARSDIEQFVAHKLKVAMAKIQYSAGTCSKLYLSL